MRLDSVLRNRNTWNTALTKVGREVFQRAGPGAKLRRLRSRMAVPPYQVGYSTHVLRQASARARRPTQTLPCKVFFLYYAGTIQEQALALMGEKEAASQALEGVFDTGALRAMMNGGENDDILAALATTLEAGKKDARAAWNVAKPKR